MKEHKSLVKTVSGILSFTILFMGVFVLSASADGTDTVCVSDHFSKLKYVYNGVTKERIPPNEIGTCTHSAMSMMLSFYDFYWHDSFVPTICLPDGTPYEMGWENGKYSSTTNSVIETFNAYPESAAWNHWQEIDGYDDYRDFAENFQNYYLQPHLISIAESETLSGAIGIVPMLDFQVVKVLEAYLLSRNLGPEQGVTVHIEYGFPTTSNLNASRETLFNTIKEKINDGHPVMFLGLDYIDVLPNFIDGDDWEIAAHAMIAYDVIGEDDEEDILLHTGWNGDETQYYNSTPFTHLNSAIWIEIDEEILPHQCTEKYEDSSDSTKKYCACEIYSKHDAHEEHHMFVENCDSFSHFEICHCGEKRCVESHSLTYSYYTPMQHYKSCSDCVYSGPENHSYNSISSLSPTASGHKLSCICGELSSYYENHYGYRYEKYNQGAHYAYCECGYCIGTMAHVVYVDISNIKYCIHCGERITNSGIITPTPGWSMNNTSGITYITDAGSYVDADGVIYLVDSDMELYLAGELDVYALAENAKGYPSI